MNPCGSWGLYWFSVDFALENRHVQVELWRRIYGNVMRCLTLIGFLCQNTNGYDMGGEWIVDIMKFGDVWRL